MWYDVIRCDGVGCGMMSSGVMYDVIRCDGVGCGMMLSSVMVWDVV